VWRVHAWVKRGILLYFQNEAVVDLEAGPLHFRDKVPVKSDLAAAGVRVVPPGVARYGSFLEPGAILMPGYVNVGARVGAGTMVDTWATVGSCAQVGKGVHLSGGVGIGGVLEPPQAQPVIIEDHAFLGSRSIVVEGVIVEEGAVLGANTVLTGSTSIVDVTGSSPVVTRGRVPRRAVVIPGTWPKTFPAGVFHVPCALVIGRRKPSTDEKTSLESALREFDVAV
jgi:2,3,4,5-tetrahydropyridine-2-carboxylate N-succinyltransferase